MTRVNQVPGEGAGTSPLLLISTTENGKKKKQRSARNKDVRKIWERANRMLAFIGGP